MMNFEKSVHNALWGSESWEVSAHPSDPSVIADGERNGVPLREVYPNFPLLFKVIDAKTRLSVQVHPNEETCKVTGGEPRGVYTDHLDDLRARMTKGVGSGTPQPPQAYNVGGGEERTFCADPAAFFAAAIAGGAKKVRLPKAFYHLTTEQDRRLARLQAEHPDVTFDYAGSEFGGSTEFLKNFTPVLRAKVEALKDGGTLMREKGDKSALW